MRYYAWWSFYIDIASEAEIEKAIVNMEAALGHKLKVWEFEEDDYFQEETGKTRFHVSAWCYLEAAEPDQVCLHVLKQVFSIASPAFSFNRYVKTKTVDENEMFALNWEKEAYHHLMQFASSAVQIGEYVAYPDEDYQLLVKNTPVITLPPSSSLQQDYVAHYRLRLKAPNKDVALRHLWPDIQKDFSSDVALLETAPCPNAKGYFILKAEQILKGHTEAQALMTCLAITDKNLLTLEYDDNDKLKFFASNNPSKEDNLEFTGNLSFILQPFTMNT